MLDTSLLVMNRLNKTEFAIFISLMWYLLLKDLTHKNLFNSAGPRSAIGRAPDS